MLPAKRVMLLSCRSPFLDDSKVYCPLANLYLKSYVNTYLPSVDVELRDDDYNLDDMSWLEGVDAVGISIMTPQRHEALTLARAIKHARPDIAIIAGGPHVKHYCHDLEPERSLDHLVPLDGEKALIGLLTGALCERVISSVLSREDIACQPRPDRSSANARDIIRRYTYLLDGKAATTMMTARGCPERCTFCEDALTTVRRTGLDSLERQLDDIVALGYRGVYIFDDLFAMSLPVIRPMCGALKARDLVYRCNAQARYFTKLGDQMAALLGDTGCHEIAFGAESGSQKILDNVAKRCTVKQNYETVAFAKRHGLLVKAFMLIGLPGEDWNTLRETEAFIRDSGIDDFQCAVYMPFRGTQIRTAVEDGENIDLMLQPQGSDGEVSGAYGTLGGETAYEVRTKALSRDDLKKFREYLVKRYRPASHRAKWSDDKFFDQADHTLELERRCSDQTSARQPLPAIQISRNCDGSHAFSPNKVQL